ncbi:hypothetical protein LBMAG56_31680 [Verrucomicrobiota bacterium]|nr:hypothetical protein LBMAG56_31680 [Verrucomicrobiota bacterium]
MHEITFSIAACHETGGYVARWDAPGGGGITTQGNTIAGLGAKVADGVAGYFGAE